MSLRLLIYLFPSIVSSKSSLGVSYRKLPILYSNSATAVIGHLPPAMGKLLRTT